MRSTGFLSERHSPWTKIWQATVVLFALTSVHAQEPSVACKLLQTAEIESALGGKAAKFSGSSAGDTHFCRGQVGSLKVLIRVANRLGDSGGVKEQKGIEIARAQGWKVEVKKEGDLTCSTAIPPASAAQTGVNTTCSILRAGKVVAVEVNAPSQKEMASMEAVRKLVQKAVTRL
jgi:hypothetical protein